MNSFNNHSVNVSDLIAHCQSQYNSRGQILDYMVYLLRKQFVTGINTWGQCFQDKCKNASCGSGPCKYCMAKAIEEFTQSPSLSIALLNATEEVKRIVQNLHLILEEQGKQ